MDHSPHPCPRPPREGLPAPLAVLSSGVRDVAPPALLGPYGSTQMEGKGSSQSHTRGVWLWPPIS